jgi:hypothetical protein
MAPSEDQQHEMLRSAFTGDTTRLRSLLSDINSAVVQAFEQIGGARVNELANRVVAMPMDEIMQSPSEVVRLAHKRGYWCLPPNRPLTLMAAAAEAGQISVVEMLLKARASPDSPVEDHDHRFLPLKTCVMSKARTATDCMLLLLQAGAAVDKQISSGETFCLAAFPI